jgi:hypothetical protein
MHDFSAPGQNYSSSWHQNSGLKLPHMIICYHCSLILLKITGPRWCNSSYLANNKPSNFLTEHILWHARAHTPLSEDTTQLRNVNYCSILSKVRQFLSSPSLNKSNRCFKFISCLVFQYFFSASVQRIPHCASLNHLHPLLNQSLVDRNFFFALQIRLLSYNFTKFTTSSNSRISTIYYTSQISTTPYRFLPSKRDCFSFINRHFYIRLFQHYEFRSPKWVHKGEVACQYFSPPELR